jgi:hypothetical protein
MMLRNLHLTVLSAVILVLPALSACTGMTVTPSAGNEVVLATQAQSNLLCEACDQATLAAALTQEKIDQAAATAEIVRANAQSTLNSANATLNAAQTQAQDNSAIAAANAQATLNSAGSTQSVALTQSMYDLQATQAAGTLSVEATITQQNKDDIAAATQTASANYVATQTQFAVAAQQRDLDQSHQLQEQRQGPITFLWKWLLPAFLVIFAGLFLWGIWLWLKTQQANQRILEARYGRLAAAEVIEYPANDSQPYIESNIVESHPQIAEPEEQVDRWIAEVKGKLLDHDEKDKNDSQDN